MSLGGKIKLLRKGKYTQEELAELLGVHINTIVRWERDERVPDANKLKILAKVFGTTTDYLLDGIDNQRILGEHTSENELASFTSKTPNIKEQSFSTGIASLTLENGRRIEAPATPEGYAFLREMLPRLMPVAVVTG